jgi:hypothetical protein
MSLYDYRASRQILSQDPPFYALIMAAMSKADTVNQAKLQLMWPDVWEEAYTRYNAPGALLPEEREDEPVSATITLRPEPEDNQDEMDRRIEQHERYLASEGADHLYEGHGE